MTYKNFFQCGKKWKSSKGQEKALCQSGKPRRKQGISGIKAKNQEGFFFGETYRGAGKSPVKT